MGHTGQTLADWRSELKFAMDIVDDHLSLYHLTVEPGTEPTASTTVATGKESITSGLALAHMVESLIQQRVRDPATWMAHCEQHGSGLRRTVVVGAEETKQELVVLGMRTKAGINFARFKQLTKADLMQVVFSFI
ncbi:hypothetical protein BG000_011377 [Podila horticola]|nr:hypothetical protein BG000_011377 [Podila horticola]